MVLEATMVCIDNSEWMRNGDYPPTRFQAQSDAVNLICGAKTQANPENTVGLLTMAGKGVRVLVTPTPDLGKILFSMQGLEVDGKMNLPSGVQVAQLALKHRQNKNQRQRIVMFAGSPIDADKETLVRIGKKLKKNNVAVDIVNFGEEDPSKLEKLEAFLSAVNSNDNSHLVTVPPDSAGFSDVLISSPVFTGDGEGGSGFAAAAAAGAAAAAAGIGAGAGGFEFGVDPNLDPELAMAIRVSMEEERQRQERSAKEAAERAAKEAAEAGGAEQGAKGEGDADMAEAPGKAAAGGAEPMDDDQALLQRALEMSMADAAKAPTSTPGTAAHQGAGEIAMADAGEDADLALAIQMSMQESGQGSGGDAASLLGDTGFVNSVLASLPGVDPNDPSVRDVLQSLGGGAPAEKKNGDSKEPKDEKDGKS